MKLEDIKRVCEEATPGPWATTLSTDKDDWDYWRVRAAPGDNICKLSLSFLEPRTDERDATFIAIARTVLPQLVAVAEAARSALDCFRTEGGTIFLRDSGSTFCDRLDSWRNALAALESDDG